ncbi:hypothetical protein NDU88_001456 [Pleurodeles waltl]|uniref:Uncharacterized protein n=1 Tax=Pleurodeles waltl TaxID=8319 RepID=A0AAV7LB11_PLEWA|nr:hypothetical protein NDU88_001456 [Pleurodeles waltl]
MEAGQGLFGWSPNCSTTLVGGTAWACLPSPLRKVVTSGPGLEAWFACPRAALQHVKESGCCGLGSRGARLPCRKGADGGLLSLPIIARACLPEALQGAQGLPPILLVLTPAPWEGGPWLPEMAMFLGSGQDGGRDRSLVCRLRLGPHQKSCSAPPETPVEIERGLPVCRGPGSALRKTQREVRCSRWSSGRARPQSGKILASGVARDNGRWSYPIGGARADRPQRASLCAVSREGGSRGG